MKVLIVGGGGREHAMAWKAAQSEQVELVYVAPGNAGTATESKVINIDISAEDIQGLITFAKRESIELTIIGPEAPLVAGIVDAFNNENLACFGPTKLAAQLEGSKTFCKDFLKRHNIPTASYESFTDIELAKSYIQQQGVPIVIKADGLAAGKGVVIAQSIEEANAAVEDMLSANKFGEAGHRVVIEEFLVGEEASFIVMSDGNNILPLASSQDHKARDEGDTGPNTGGMGAYSPAPIVTESMHQKVMDEVITPTIEAMAKDGMPYTGFLYAGLMITESGKAKVLEYNCRFGDPETQPILFRMQSDLVNLCLSACEGKLSQQVNWDDRVALGVVLAAEGYPGGVKKGLKIQGLDKALDESVKVFHAGTKLENNQVFTNGGRVLCVTALGNTVKEAQDKAYKAVGNIEWQGMFYRKDIGNKALNHHKN